MIVGFNPTSFVRGSTVNSLTTPWSPNEADLKFLTANSLKALLVEPITSNKAGLIQAVINTWGNICSHRRAKHESLKEALGASTSAGSGGYSVGGGNEGGGNDDRDRDDDHQDRNRDNEKNPDDPYFGSCEGEDFRVFVRRNGVVDDFLINDRDTTCNLKGYIRNRLGISRYDQRLIFQNNDLQNHEVLTDVGVEEDCFIDLVARIFFFSKFFQARNCSNTSPLTHPLCFDDVSVTHPL